MINLHVELFDTGYCLNFENMVASNKPWRIVPFYSLVALIEHPRLGPILFDTGYSSHIHEVCKCFPYFIYPLVTPIKQIISAAERIQKYGYKAEEIKHVIISHFHADHIGGLRDFPNATFHYLSHSYEIVKSLNGLQAVRQGFLPDLIPEGFVNRSSNINKTISIFYPPFETGYDLFGDQSVIGIELPGHAEGQLGILVNTPRETIFLVADACWQSSNYQNLEYPNLFGRLAIHNYEEFCNTLRKLNTLHKQFNHIKIIPTHCLDTRRTECISSHF